MKDNGMEFRERISHPDGKVLQDTPPTHGRKTLSDYGVQSYSFLVHPDTGAYEPEQRDD